VVDQIVHRRSASSRQIYAEKFTRISPQTLFNKLPLSNQLFLEEKAFSLRFTQQELRELCQISNDLNMWKETPLETLWPSQDVPKKRLMALVRNQYLDVQGKAKSYIHFDATDKPKSVKPRLVTRVKGELGLGYCPVASEKTRCCNLLTLDAVERCGFDCSYCSIQSFYHENEVRFDEGFSKKLQKLSLDPDQTYHIGTGQSSDSLMWGNHNGNLAALCEFAERNPNVILEFKTKSKNIKWLLNNDFPANVLCTWSLNTQEIIDNEEHQAASLAERINCARKIADKGRLVGFHFHPMIWYEGFEQSYADIAETLIGQFHLQEVALISMGTLTYTKDVMRTIRKRDFKSKILQMPFEKVAGKFAYPDTIKISMFQGLYSALSAWHEKVFFYLCMEPAKLWQPVFGVPDYADNAAFERAMKQAYLDKINLNR
jgi:spore photoproduct lyase